MNTYTHTIDVDTLNYGGPDAITYLRSLVDLPVVFTTYEGERIVGTLRDVDACGNAIIDLPGGKWGRGRGRQIEIVEP